MLQSNNLELSLTFQLYCGILWGINLNIQTVLLGLWVGTSIECSLQYAKEMMPLNLRRIMVVCSSFYLKWAHTTY
jgi:hypothetical protein